MSCIGAQEGGSSNASMAGNAPSGLPGDITSFQVKQTTIYYNFHHLCFYNECVSKPLKFRSFFNLVSGEVENPSADKEKYGAMYYFQGIMV